MENKWLSQGWEYIEDYSPDMVHLFDSVKVSLSLGDSSPQWFDVGYSYRTLYAS